MKRKDGKGERLVGIKPDLANVEGKTPRSVRLSMGGGGRICNTSWRMTTSTNRVTDIWTPIPAIQDP